MGIAQTTPAAALKTAVITSMSAIWDRGRHVRSRVNRRILEGELRHDPPPAQCSGGGAGSVSHRLPSEAGTAAIQLARFRTADAVWPRKPPGRGLGRRVR